MRSIPGVPMVYVKRSVMVMEPMADSSEGVREGLERSKFRSGLRSKRDSTASLKRKRNEDEESSGSQDKPPGGRDLRVKEVMGEKGTMDQPIKKRRGKGPKGPNPLSVKKPKSKPNAPEHGAETAKGGDRAGRIDAETLSQSAPVVDIIVNATNGAQEAPSKRKRKRKHKSTLVENLQTDIAPDHEAQDSTITNNITF